MHGSRSKIPRKNLVRQRCAEGFNSDVKGLMWPNACSFSVRCCVNFDLFSFDQNEWQCSLKARWKWSGVYSYTSFVAIRVSELVYQTFFIFCRSCFYYYVLVNFLLPFVRKNIFISVYLKALFSYLVYFPTYMKNALLLYFIYIDFCFPSIFIYYYFI
jgi:hypothetical protein